MDALTGLDHSTGRSTLNIPILLTVRTLHAGCLHPNLTCIEGRDAGAATVCLSVAEGARAAGTEFPPG